jgi:hypothetical protein
VVLSEEVAMSCPKCGSHRIKNKRGLWADCAGCGESRKCGSLSASLFNSFVRKDGQRIAVFRPINDEDAQYLGWLGKKNRILDDFKVVVGKIEPTDEAMLEKDMLWQAKAGQIALPEFENAESRKQYQEWLETK